MAPFIRIFLRYVAGVMLAAGYFSDDVAQMIVGDEELVQFLANAAAMAIAAGTEFWYWLSRRFGWSK